MISSAQICHTRVRGVRATRSGRTASRWATRFWRAFVIGLALAIGLVDGPRPATAAPHVARRGAAPRSRRAPARVIGAAHAGQVRFVTATGVYLDRGAAEGMTARQLIFLARPGRVKRIKCLIDLVGDHTAVCRGVGAHVGDVFRLAPTPRQRGPVLERSTAPPVVPEATLQVRAQTMATAPHEKVAFAGQRSSSLPPSVTLGGSVTVWSMPGTETGPRATEQIDVQLHRVRLGETDLRLDAALTAVRWQTRAADLRFRPRTPTQIYLWDAEVSRREVDDLTVFSFGRIWPWHVPGVALLDGLQVGRRNLQGTAEGGLYGGLIPTAIGLIPTTDIWAGGVYGALTQSGASTDVFRVLREEARVGLRHGPSVGLVTEGEVLTDATLNGWAANAGARFRYAAATERQPVWEQAYVALRIRPTSASGVSMQFRYAGVAPEQQPLLINELPALRGGTHTAVNAYWVPRRWLQIAGFGSWHLDRDSGLHETEAGLDVGNPRLLGDVGGVWLGASLGEGWLRSRTAYVQLLSRRLRAIQILARLTGSTSVFDADATSVNLAEIGGTLQIEVAVSDRFRVRGRGLVRAPTAVQGLTPSGDNLTIVSGVDAIWLL